ncbi:hypothetical protein RUM43_012007 [Polyplax serrata]|uniref:Uncharacterized protein n=1 Tax=Polyplax serrata TaxID=468196 RepID=A0AAN8S7I3_POLSC
MAPSHLLTSLHFTQNVQFKRQHRNKARGNVEFNTGTDSSSLWTFRGVEQCTKRLSRRLLNVMEAAESTRRSLPVDSNTVSRQTNKTTESRDVDEYVDPTRGMLLLPRLEAFVEHPKLDLTFGRNPRAIMAEADDDDDDDDEDYDGISKEALPMAATDHIL